ncbi:MAG: hypothetical protein ACPG4T_20385, partial [Nannocystaceae bacterium]
SCGDFGEAEFREAQLSCYCKFRGAHPPNSQGARRENLRAACPASRENSDPAKLVTRHSIHPTGWSRPIRLLGVVNNSSPSASEHLKSRYGAGKRQTP